MVSKIILIWNNQTMGTSTLTDNLQIVKNTLYVESLQTMQDFYTKVLWFDLIWSKEGRVLLGKNDQVILELTNDSQAHARKPYGAWLYHIAYVFNTQAWLANSVKQVATLSSSSYDWSADHDVSEAFYFHDPERNGIELYYDRPAHTWTWTDGRVKMWSLYLDPNQYIEKYSSEWADQAFKIGHNHLKVGDIEIAKKFYVDVLWFDITAQLQWALFVSVNGYHHHFGFNVWESADVSMRPHPQLWLGTITLQLWSKQDIERLASRLAEHKIDYIQEDESLRLQDPRGNMIIFDVK
jgi:catechol 2,3-dioxygenase